MIVRGWHLKRCAHKCLLVSAIKFIVSFKVLPHVHNGLAKFCSNVATWMQKAAVEGPYEYSDYNSFSKVMF